MNKHINELYKELDIVKLAMLLAERPDFIEKLKELETNESSNQ